MMFDFNQDDRIVLTLDAGGTNFVFGAMQKGESIVDSITYASNAHDLEICLKIIIKGFEEIKNKINAAVSAISFAFPGPADYNKGIIGDLGNLPAFRGGVALKAMLEEYFNIPVFIQNDGDLYAYGEAIAGVLPEINNDLKRLGVEKEYKNIIGLTLGTGFGAGVVINGMLLTGDNSISTEIWNIANSISPERNIEDGVSTRAIINEYNKAVGTETDLMPKDIYDIAIGDKLGDKEMAIKAFEIFGTHLGDAIATLIMLFDANVVIGGGLTGAKALYMPAVMEVLKGKFRNGQERLVQKVYSWDNDDERIAFTQQSACEISVPFSTKILSYDPVKKVCVANSKLGASKAIALGAYAYALSMINNKIESCCTH